MLVWLENWLRIYGARAGAGAGACGTGGLKRGLWFVDGRACYSNTKRG